MFPFLQMFSRPRTTDIEIREHVGFLDLQVTAKTVILRACDFFGPFAFLVPDQMFFGPLHKIVILRVCDFLSGWQFSWALASRTQI
jgi:hypothetical protein